MKRIILILAILIGIGLLALPLLAQNSQELVMLDETTPGVDVVISLPPASAGVIGVELKQASVTLTDSTGNIVFYMADPRVHALELQIMPDTGTHTLTVERLPGVQQAYVMVKSQATLTDLGADASATLSDSSVTMYQQRHESLSAGHPGDTIPLIIPAQSTGSIQAAFPGAQLTAQLTDSAGRTVATLYGGQVDSFNIIMDGGDYNMTLLQTNPTQNIDGTVSVMPAPASTLAGLIAQSAVVNLPADIAANAQSNLPPEQNNQVSAETVVAENCSITVNPSSINLRSGPGTGYSVLGYSLQGDIHLVGGSNPEGTWLVVADDAIGSGWMATRLGTMSGNCSDLAIYDIPYRAAPEQQVIYATPEVITLPSEIITVASDGSGSSSGGGSSSSSSSHDDDDHEDHEDHDDDDHHEHEDEHEDDD